MDYTIKLKLSFAELLALDTALQHERKRLLRDIHNYAAYEDILTDATHEYKLIERIVDMVDDAVTGGGSHE